MFAVNEGYGDDNQNTLEPFPFSQPVEKGKEEDAELRRQLKQMGKGMSRILIFVFCPSSRYGWGFENNSGIIFFLFLKWNTVFLRLKTDFFLS